MFKRIALFLITNLAIMFVLSLVMNLLGVGPMLTQQGLDLGNLIVYAAVFGFVGSLIPLALSKWTAKRLTGARVINTPANEVEAWLVEIVRRQALKAGVNMPEVSGLQLVVALYKASESRQTP